VYCRYVEAAPEATKSYCDEHHQGPCLDTFDEILMASDEFKAKVNVKL
jgi:hypothetical protein